jgi:beta-lactamase regulating signal transducer with metallopeptidase domain
VNSINAAALANHLWQSTLFAALVGCIALLLRRNSARTRHMLWFAASAKFLVPFALLTAIGAQIPWHFSWIHETDPASLAISGGAAIQITRFGAQGAMALAQVTHTANHGDFVRIAFGVLWGLGALVVGARWFARWKLVRRALHDSTPTNLVFVIPVRSSSIQFEPGVVGVLHPVLLLPKGIEQRLTPAEMDAVLAHERCHVRWRDNLAAALHMLVQNLFWFHPLIWWIGTRLLEERERACDEAVLAEGHRPASYAEGILKVCDHYLASRLSCVAGISGANITRRIEDIMDNRPIEKLGAMRKMVITSAACATIAVPIALEVLTSPNALAEESAVPTSDLRTLNFKDADIERVAAGVAAVTHKTLILDPKVRAQVTVRSTAPVTPDIFYEAFVSVLAMHGFTAVPGAGGSIQIVRDPTSRFASDRDDASKRIGGPSDESVTQVIAVKHVPAGQLVMLLRQLVPPTGQINAYSQSNVLIISDHASTVNRIMEITSRIDQVGVTGR